jgi:soluble lytic murein transglycosylase-like protein
MLERWRASTNPRWRARVLGLGTAAAVLLGIGISSAAVLGFGSGEPAGQSAAAVPSVSASDDSPSPSASSGAPSPSSAVPRSPSARPAITASRRPVQVVLPPPPPTTAPSSPGASKPACPTYTGPAAERATVQTALQTAGAHHYWDSTNPPAKQAITVPTNLMYAFAWQESGWQSTIVACDGGVGTMQIMPGTAAWMRQNLRVNYDVNTLSGNTMLGAVYLEWLIWYFGEAFFGGNYDLSNTALLDSVISAYNVGPAAVDPTKGDAGIPNWQYVYNVKALMTNCPCA